MRFTASSAIGEIAAVLFGLRTLAAMSASWKNCRRECAQHDAGVMGPGERDVS
ncbi:alkylhydroperoxidase family enzyme [Aureimonas pseudogalii]|uniref:Alkylhydroperoxidase family enzyme n=1 Tax=Aureimonas pseudogalii TaxID=1744844 RepID=A0A7W6H9A8_9HYPH|nr:alkylhydroperoxidase family enzyme [Aureimonas pseudogalii]